MVARASMTRLLPLLREFGALDKRRSREGLTPVEYQRWVDLTHTLSKHYPQGEPPEGAERREHMRLPLRLLVEYKNLDQLHEAVITNVSRGGLFISTAFPPEIGTQFTLCIRVDASGESVDLPCEVVSHNVGRDFSTSALGMGLRFRNLDEAQRAVVDSLFDIAVEQAADDRV
jgi:uncharacterized protein (TIGR02266 family)